MGESGRKSALRAWETRRRSAKAGRVEVKVDLEIDDKNSYSGFTAGTLTMKQARALNAMIQREVERCTRINKKAKES